MSNNMHLDADTEKRLREVHENVVIMRTVLLGPPPSVDGGMVKEVAELKAEQAKQSKFRVQMLAIIGVVMTIAGWLAEAIHIHFESGKK